MLAASDNDTQSQGLLGGLTNLWRAGWQSVLTMFFVVGLIVDVLFSEYQFIYDPDPNVSPRAVPDGNDMLILIARMGKFVRTGGG
jgi:hypothetical protein